MTLQIVSQYHLRQPAKNLGEKNVLETIIPEIPHY
jgi:hypothetical protein